MRLASLKTRKEMREASVWFAESAGGEVGKRVAGPPPACEPARGCVF